MVSVILRVLNCLEALARKTANRPSGGGALHPRYRIPDCSFANPNWVYRSGFLGSAFQEGLKSFQVRLTTSVAEPRSETYLKFGDGDYYFLRGIPLGSASPGKRAISKPLSDRALAFYGSQASRADFYLCENLLPNRAMFHSIFRRQPDFPAEYTYGLLASRWLTKEFAGSVGLIGSASKVKLVRRLLEFQEYRDYLGLDGFEDYVEIPDLYAADEPTRSSVAVGEQLARATSKIFLVGVGHLKSALFAELGSYRAAVYLDVGSGIDALAGIIDTNRPYMQNWINYQLDSRTPYENLDYLNFNNQNIKILSRP